MALFRRLKQIRHRQPSPPRRFCGIGCQLIGSDYLVEEETLPSYEHDQYYPAHIGEVSNRDTKLSENWVMGLTQREHKYAALKISTQLQKHPLKRRRELMIYEHLSKVRSPHPGQAYIRDLYDTFEIAGPYGCHQCLIQPPMHQSILDMLDSNAEPFNAPLLKLVLKRLLTALDFLHREAGIVHTDIKSDNLMLTIADDSLLQDFEKAELENPSPRKIIDETRTIYTSRSFRKPANDKWGLPILCDFGEARVGKEHQTGPMIQPHIYRAPEVTFEMTWGPPIDIWNLGALVWDLFEGKHLFHHVMDEGGKYDPFKHMAQISGFLGPPPKEFVSRSETTLQCFDVKGNWKASEYAELSMVSLEDIETRLSGSDKHMFLRFIRSMLKWLPEERKTAEELLDDPWLNDIIE